MSRDVMAFPRRYGTPAFAWLLGVFHNVGSFVPFITPPNDTRLHRFVLDHSYYVYDPIQCVKCLIFFLWCDRRKEGKERK